MKENVKIFNKVIQNLNYYLLIGSHTLTPSWEGVNPGQHRQEPSGRH